MGNGPVIAATNIDLQNAKSVTNSGTISAADNFSISGQSIDSSFGTLQSGGQMSLVTAGDVNLTSATVNAGSLDLKAGGNLVLNTAVNTLSQVSDTGATQRLARSASKRSSHGFRRETGCKSIPMSEAAITTIYLAYELGPSFSHIAAILPGISATQRVAALLARAGGPVARCGCWRCDRRASLAHVAGDSGIASAACRR